MQVEVEAYDELGVIIEPINDLLCVAIPDESAHVVAGTGEDVRVVRAKLDSAHGQRVLSQHHDR